jgi:hypothetical protein
MKNQNQELKQAENLSFLAKYAQLSKYQELSDLEVAIVAGGSRPMTEARDVTAFGSGLSRPVIKNDI